MEHSELAETLKCFTPKERERLELFLQSPYCTGMLETGSELQLVRYIGRALQDKTEDGELLEHQKIYSALYPGREYSAQTLHNLASSTLKLIRRFIDAEVLQQNSRPLHEFASIVKFLTEKGANDLCEKYLKRMDRGRKPDETWDDVDFYQNWRAENIKSQHLGRQNLVTDDYNLQGSLQALDRFYLQEWISNLGLIFNQNRLTPFLDPEVRQELIDRLENWQHSPFYHHPLVQLYKQVLLFFHLDEEGAKDAFDIFLKYLADYEQKLPLFHLKRLEAFAINFCIRYFYQEKYRNVLFQFFQKWIQPERIDQNNWLTATELLSLVQIALAGQQFEWVQKFLDTYRKKIQGTQSSEEYYLFNRALLLFYQGNFDEARTIVVRLSFHELPYKYLAKALEIKLFYETGEDDFELVETRLNNMSVALHRESKMPKEKKKRYSQFVNFMMRLNRWHSHIQPDVKRLKKMYEDVRNSQNTAEWRWLKDKLEVLLRKHDPDNKDLP